ncbi:hypothetical protein [Siccibacter colletis]
MLEKDGHPTVSDLSGSISIVSIELLTEELVRVDVFPSPAEIDG